MTKSPTTERDARRKLDQLVTKRLRVSGWTGEWILFRSDDKPGEEPTWDQFVPGGTVEAVTSFGIGDEVSWIRGYFPTSSGSQFAISFCQIDPRPWGRSLLNAH